MYIYCIICTDDSGLRYAGRSRLPGTKWTVVSWCGEKKDCTCAWSIAAARCEMERLLLGVLLVLVKKEWRSDLYGFRCVVLSSHRRIVASSHLHIHTPTYPLFCISCWFRAAPNQSSMFAWALFGVDAAHIPFGDIWVPKWVFCWVRQGCARQPEQREPVLLGTTACSCGLTGSRHCRPAERPLVTPQQCHSNSCLYEYGQILNLALHRTPMLLRRPTPSDEQVGAWLPESVPARE